MTCGLLVITAVEAEAAAVRSALGTAAPDPSVAPTVLVGGAGPAAAAAATAAHLAARPAGGGDDATLVLSAGIGGGFGPLRPGELAVASAIVFADLGAQTADGFTGAEQLGFGRQRYDVGAALAVALADRTGGHLGTVLTVATVTGTAARRDELQDRHPDAVAEAMEGAGVAAAASAAGVAFGELRAISNAVGPRDREAWRMTEALDALGRAVAAVAAAPWTS